MEAFLTPSKVSQLRSMLLDNSDQGMLKNIWLLSQNMHKAFRSGHIKIQPATFNIQWDDESELETPDATQAKVCTHHVATYCLLN